MAKILVLEDDPILAKSLCFNIECSGDEPVWSASLQDFKGKMRNSSFDLVLLDVQLPDGNGIDLCQELRKNKFSEPILLITAQSSEDMAVKGLLCGANDYIKKPFSMRELLARIRLQLKRTEKIQDKGHAEFAGLKVDYDQRLAFYQGREIKLNATKLDILYFMLVNHEKVISRDTLLQFLQKESEVFDRTVDAHISQLRRVLKEENIDHIRITSIYGSGYRLEAAKKISTPL